MSYSNYGNRGRGFRGPTQAARAPRCFGRPRFPRPPFRHVAPPRLGPPARFGMPWQPNNMFFQPHPLRGSSTFRGDGRRRRFCNYDVRFPAPNMLPTPMDYEEEAMGGLQLEAEQDESAPQLPLLGSEEERQQKITETADRLKQKLSSFSSDKITDIWSEDVPSGPAEDNFIENKRIPVLGYKSPELNLTYNDLKDIGRINPDNTQNTTDVCNVTNNTDNSDVILDENDNGSQLVIPDDQMTNLVNVMPDDNEYVATDDWQLHEPVDNSYNLEQLDVHGDNNMNENELLESDLQYNASSVNISQDQDYQQQGISQEIGIYPTDVIMEQDESETLNLQAASFSNDAINQDVLQQEGEEGFQNEVQNELQNKFENEVQNEFQSEVQNEFQSEVQNEFQSEVQNEFQSEVQNEFQNEVQDEFQSEVQNEFQTEVQNEFQSEVQDEFQSEVQDELQSEVQSEVQNEMQNEMQNEVQNEERSNVEVQESVLNFHEYAENSNSSNNMQPVLTDVPVNNVALDNQLPRVKEKAFHSGPPRLSPHIEQELPVDFDPTTPPPILLKQDQPRVLPYHSISPDLPPLFDPTAPPPNMKCILGSTMPHEEANPPWSNAQNPMPAVYNNIEVHTGLNTHGGFILQPLPLEMSSQSNVFLTPHVDSVNFSPIFPMPSSSHSGINVHVPSMHVTSHNTYVSPNSLPELSPSSDLSSSLNKDDGLDDMQEAMRFAKEMTNMSGKADEESKSSTKSLSESNLPVNPVSEVGFIALPPGKPKVKTNKVKKVNDTSIKKKIVSEEQSAADRLSSEEIQEATVKAKEVSLIQEQDRPKVVFNLNNKTKVVNPKTWKENEKKNGMTQSVESKKTRTVSSVTKKNFEKTSRRIKEEKNLKINENNSESAMSSELKVANQDATLLHKKLVKDNTEKSQCSTISFYSKVNVQKSRSHVEKNENSNLAAEVSWKNKIISRFLKMSKNDIYNMVNNTSLRKFDIIMKRLVKEKKSTLSLEMRHAQDEKMKLYDQQEFMKQLNAMLDTDAVVSITDLPTEFIHHLNEVLQLDVQPDNHAEPAAASNSQCDPSENTNNAFSPITHATECADEKATSNNDVSQKCAKTKSHMTKTSHNEDAQEHTESNYNYVKKNICNTIAAANDSSVTNLLSLQHDLDDIFSKITKKNKIPATETGSTRGNVRQSNAKRHVNVVTTRSVEKETPLEDDSAPRLLDCPSWYEKCEKWKRKEREDPHAYRNLTKEEWEARYGSQANLTFPSVSVSTIPSVSVSTIPSVSVSTIPSVSVSTIPSVSVSTKKIAVNNKKLSTRGRGKKLYMRRRYSSESSKHTPHTRHRSLEKDKHKKSRRHSDDRGHSIGYDLEQNVNHDSNSNSSSTSTSSSSSNSTSTNSPSSNTNVTKLLRVIKENEKVAKKMTLNEAIRDEVNAEIERERKSRKSRKARKGSKGRKQKKAHHKKKKKKKKQNKKTTSSSDSSSEKDNNEEVTDRLLTESEIKREVVENQITQETIVKEELDIGHEENIESAEFANAPSLVMENKAAYLLPASQSRLESPSAQEIPVAAINATQPQPEDRQPTVSTPQPKTKAQLKQMPETSDMNDNKVPLNVFTCIPENWRTFNPASFSEHAEDSNKSCQTAETGCSQDKAVQSTDDSFINQTNNTADVACGEANESAVVQKLDACTSTESFTKIQDGNEIPADNNISAPAASALSVSDVPSASAVTQRQGASKKIDIKTYYERNMRQRRMNEKLEPKRPENPKTENPAITTRENALTSKAAEPEIAVSKSTFVPTYSGSIQDPRLLSRAAVASAANNKDSIAQTAAGKNNGQKEKRTNESTIARSASKRPEEKNSNRIVNSDKIVRKINQDKTKDKVSLVANVNNTNASSNIVTTSKIAVPRPKKCLKIKETVADEKSQDKAATELKRFKNIRSEGGKELKLKKEIAKGQKPKKKSTVASKPISQVSTKACPSLEKTTTAEEIQEKKIDNVSNVNKMEEERIQLTGSREDKVNNSNAKTEPSTSSVSANSDNNKLHNVKTKELSSSCNNLKRKNVEKTINNVDDINARSKTARNKEIRHVKHAKNVASVEITDKNNQSAREICNVVPELNVSTASTIFPGVPENKKSYLEKINRKDFSTSDIQQSDAAKDTKLSLSYAAQDQIKKSNSRDVSASTINRDASSISESDATPRADSVDRQSKEDQLLINNNTKENNMELVEPDACKSARAKNKSAVGKIAELSSSTSNENSREQQGTPSDSLGSPFKGFLQETMIDFEPPNLFNLKLDEVDANKKSKIFLDDCNVNYAAGSCKDIEGQQAYEIQKSSTDYANTNIDINENFNITFDNTLLASDKECATSEKGGKSSTADESGEAHASKSSSDIVTATLRDETNDAGGGESETARQLMSEEGYVIKESIFINEEEIIPSEARSIDLASKLKTTTDPSLSDALEATASDDALRLPESQSAEQLDNHMYLETHMSAEKTACDKLPSFDSEEPLDSDIFYLDDRLRGTATFDAKDDESVHFPVDEQRSPRYDITPVASPPELIAPCANLLKPEARKFDLKHISSTDSDLLAETSVERPSIDTPRTLNIPTKAALKEPAANVFLKSPTNLPMASKEVSLETLDKAQQSDAQLNYQTSAWLDGQNNRVRAQATHGRTGAQNFVNVNTISSTQNNTLDEPACKNGDHKSIMPSTNVENRFRGSALRNPVVELRKMKELDELLGKRGQKSSEKVKERVYKGQKKHNGTIFHKLKDKRPMKYQAKATNRMSLVKRLKRMKRSGRLAGTAREDIIARMLEIDLEMHKLATEKLKLHELLQSNVPSTENSAANRSVILRENDTGAGQPEVPPMLGPMLAESSEVSHAKPALSSRSSSVRKRVSCNSEDDETTSYTPVHQKTKMPVIRWKKKPRLEQTVRQEEDDDEQEDLDETAEQQSSTSAKKKVNDGLADASEDVQKSGSNAAQADHEAQGEKTTGKSDEEAACDIDSRRAICPDKSADDRSEDLAEAETERSKYFDIDKQNDVPPSSEAARLNSRPSSGQVRGTPEPSSIYFDDSTWDSLVQNTAPEVHEHSKETGLALLDESLKKEQAKSRKMKATIRQKKKQQLDNFLSTVNNLTMEEEELPLSKLYIEKLRQKRDLLDSLGQRKEDTGLTVDPGILKNVDEVINAVAENRVENLYDPQSEARASDDVPSTSSSSSVLQSDKHKFYVDAEANANSDWPSREKENAEEEIATQQDSNDVPGADGGSNHVFKAVSQDKALYDERNVEPDSSITPEETLIQSHSSDSERDRSKDCNNGSRNFDIIVSVPKVLIKDDFSLEMLQKFKGTEGGGLVSTGLVDSTTNVFSANSERLEEKDKKSRDTAPAVNPIVEEKQENKKDENDETKDKHAVDVNEREETIDSAASNTPSASQSNPVKSGSGSDETENEESGDSVSSNDKTAERDTSVSNSTVEKIDTSQKKSDAESEQLSNDAIALKQDCQNTENAVVKEEEKNNPANKSGTFERILDHDQSTGSSAPPDLTSERSEDSNETSVEKSIPEHMLISPFTFNKATAKGEEMSMKRRKYSSAPVRRSTRNSNENAKPSRIKEPDASSSERESSVLHQRNLTARSRSKSPSWAMPDEKVINNGRKNRVARKMQNRGRKVGTRAKNKNPAKHLDMITESAPSNNNTAAIAKKRKQQTEWQIKNCKVRLVDCKPVLLKYVNSEVLDRFKLIAVDPCAPSDSSCTQHTISNQNTVTPNTVSESFFSADKLCPQISQTKLEVKIEKEKDNKDLAQESVSQAAEIDEEESTKMHYMIHSGPILDIKIFQNSFLAASEDNKIYRYNLMSNGILNIYKGHKSAVTCLYIYKSDDTGHTKNLVYSGSLDGSLRCYNITSGELVNNPVQVNSPIQCMDQSWGIIFIGTKSGHVSRFYIKTSDIKGNSIPFSDKSVLALKATNEGPRRILIVASRNQPIAIRDAHTGLFLRTISGQKNHTVYSLLRHDNLIYCGTSSTSINVFDFTTGEQAVQYDAGVGIVCMRLYKQLLFAGCYDGNIYVFDISTHKLVCSIHGPGNMLLSIEVVNNKIIAGSKDRRLHSWQMPTQVRALL